MEFRNIVISNPARVFIKNKQLVIAQEQEISIPIEDISALMLESGQIQISAIALERLTVQGVTVFLCDQQHLPSVQLVPINRFYRKRKMLFAQFNIKKPLQKRLWQRIIQQKIRNQAACLALMQKDGSEELYAMADSVASGDSGNIEAVAAAYYFPKLFGEDFTRREENIINAALNYGYAIVRGSVARNLVVHGLEPCIGLQHHNELNPFNLADDLIEPFRPLVDLAVANMEFSDEFMLDAKRKHQIFNLTNYLMKLGQKKYRVMLASDRCTVSLANSIVQKKDVLELPELIPLEEGRYE